MRLQPELVSWEVYARCYYLSYALNLGRPPPRRLASDFGPNHQREAVASFLMTAPKARGRSAALEIAYGCNSAQGGAVALSLKIPSSGKSARSWLRHPGRNKPYPK